MKRSAKLIQYNINTNRYAVDIGTKLQYTKSIPPLCPRTMRRSYERRFRIRQPAGVVTQGAGRSALNRTLRRSKEYAFVDHELVKENVSLAKHFTCA